MYLEWNVILEILDRIFHDPIFWLFLGLVILDFLTGTTKAFIMKDVSSAVGMNGLLKHSIIVLIVVFMGLVTGLAEFTEIKYIFIFFYIFEYSISIMENLVKMGIPFPERFAKLLRQWKEDNHRKWGE